MIICSNLLNLDGIAMLGSAAFLLVYGAVSVAHLRLWHETGAHRFVIWAAIASCAAAFVVLAFYEAQHEPATLVVLAAVVAISFLFEWGYRARTRRRLHRRDPDCGSVTDGNPQALKDQGRNGNTIGLSRSRHDKLVGVAERC